MPKEKFILVSLKEEESKKLAQIITNDTSRKILDFLSEKEATETELAEKLQVPISTIHYNLQALLKGRLVEADEFHYSEKGKEVLHYKLANKYIIIAPKSTFGIKEKLMKILPVGLIALVSSSFIYFYQALQNTFSAKSIAGISEEAPSLMTAKASEAGQDMMQESANIAATGGSAAIQSFWRAFMQNPALWFLFGCVFTLILMVIIEFIIYKRNTK